mmetsp:Transcript_842/g.1313  ORF Transcript_842/g.1313 Transcript_842/m.1313 type:complete len:1406 (+) Transcript_842:13-4230(+)
MNQIDEDSYAKEDEEFSNITSFSDLDETSLKYLSKHLGEDEGIIQDLVRRASIAEMMTEDEVNETKEEEDRLNETTRMQLLAFKKKVGKLLKGFNSFNNGNDENNERISNETKHHELVNTNKRRVTDIIKNYEKVSTNRQEVLSDLRQWFQMVNIRNSSDGRRYENEQYKQDKMAQDTIKSANQRLDEMIEQKKKLLELQEQLRASRANTNGEDNDFDDTMMDIIPPTNNGEVDILRSKLAMTTEKLNETVQDKNLAVKNYVKSQKRIEGLIQLDEQKSRELERQKMIVAKERDVFMRKIRELERERDEYKYHMKGFEIKITQQLNHEQQQSRIIAMENDQLKKDNSTLKKSISSLQSEQTDKELKLNALQIALDEHKNAMRSLTIKNESLMKELENQKEDYEFIKQEHAIIKEQLGEKLEKIVSLRDELDTRKKITDTYDRSVQTNFTVYEEKEQTKAKAQKLLVDYKNKCSKQTQDLYNFQENYVTKLKQNILNYVPKMVIAHLNKIGAECDYNDTEIELMMNDFKTKYRQEVVLQFEMAIEEHLDIYQNEISYREEVIVLREKLLNEYSQIIFIDNTLRMYDQENNAELTPKLYARVLKDREQARDEAISLQAELERLEKELVLAMEGGSAAAIANEIKILTERHDIRMKKLVRKIALRDEKIDGLQSQIDHQDKKLTNLRKKLNKPKAVASVQTEPNVKEVSIQANVEKHLIQQEKKQLASLEKQKNEGKIAPSTRLLVKDKTKKLSKKPLNYKDILNVANEMKKELISFEDQMNDIEKTHKMMTKKRSSVAHSIRPEGPKSSRRRHSSVVQKLHHDINIADKTHGNISPRFTKDIEDEEVTPLEKNEVFYLKLDVANLQQLNKQLMNKMHTFSDIMLSMHQKVKKLHLNTKSMMNTVEQSRNIHTPVPIPRRTPTPLVVTQSKDYDSDDSEESEGPGIIQTIKGSSRNKDKSIQIHHNFAHHNDANTSNPFASDDPTRSRMKSDTDFSDGERDLHLIDTSTIIKVEKTFHTPAKTPSPVPYSRMYGSKTPNTMMMNKHLSQKNEVISQFDSKLTEHELLLQDLFSEMETFYSNIPKAYERSKVMDDGELMTFKDEYEFRYLDVVKSVIVEEIDTLQEDVTARYPLKLVSLSDDIKEKIDSKMEKMAKSGVMKYLLGDLLEKLFTHHFSMKKFIDQLFSNQAKTSNVDPEMKKHEQLLQQRIHQSILEKKVSLSPLSTIKNSHPALNSSPSQLLRHKPKSSSNEFTIKRTANIIFKETELKEALVSLRLYSFYLKKNLIKYQAEMYALRIAGISKGVLNFMRRKEDKHKKKIAVVNIEMTNKVRERIKNHERAVSLLRHFNREATKGEDILKNLVLLSNDLESTKRPSTTPFQVVRPPKKKQLWQSSKRLNKSKLPRITRQ